MITLHHEDCRVVLKTLPEREAEYVADIRRRLDLPTPHAMPWDLPRAAE